MVTKTYYSQFPLRTSMHLLFIGCDRPIKVRTQGLHFSTRIAKVNNIHSRKMFLFISVWESCDWSEKELEPWGIHGSPNTQKENRSCDPWNCFEGIPSWEMRETSLAIGKQNARANGAGLHFDIAPLFFSSAGHRRSNGHAPIWRKVEYGGTGVEGAGKVHTSDIATPNTFPLIVVARVEDLAVAPRTQNTQTVQRIRQQ